VAESLSVLSHIAHVRDQIKAIADNKCFKTRLKIAGISCCFDLKSCFFMGLLNFPNLYYFLKVYPDKLSD